MSKFRFCLAGEYPVDTSRIGGGVLHVMWLLGETFAERSDIDFHVVASVKGVGGVKVVERPGITVHYVGGPKHSIIPEQLAQAARIAPVMRELNPDVVNSHYHATTEAAVMAGCKVVDTIHGISHYEVPYLNGRVKAAIWLQASLVTRTMRKADAVIAVAQYGLDEYARWINGPSAVIDVPIEDMFSQVPPMSGSKGILFAGGIGRRKNLSAVVNAMPAVARKHPDAVLYVCGGVSDRKYKAALDSFVASHGIENSIRYLGVVDRFRLAELLGESIALVLPSYQETMPGVICQAMAAGRVPVVAPVGGVPELVDDGVTGYLVDADDSDKLAERLIELMDDIDKAREMGLAAKRVAVERCDRHTVADRILKICRSVADGGQELSSESAIARVG